MPSDKCGRNDHLKKALFCNHHKLQAATDSAKNQLDANTTETKFIEEQDIYSLQVFLHGSVVYKGEKYTFMEKSGKPHLHYVISVAMANNETEGCMSSLMW